jgi:hypothetical protein
MDTPMPRIVAALRTSAVIAACLLAARSSPAAEPGQGGPTLAVEDTMRTSVPEVLVRAPRVTLDHILDRVARGEARRESLLADQSFVATFRALRRDKGGDAVPVREVVTKVYKKRPGKVRTVTVRDWRPKARKNVTVEASSGFSSSMGEQIVNFAFRPEGRRDYKFRIVGRDLVGDHLVYRIAFEPRSALDLENPHGLVWVDTNEFVIVRQEIGWPRSPVPLIVKSLPRMVIERQKVNGHWVLHRMLARMELTIPVPEWGRAFDMAWQFGEYTINTGLPDDLFPARGERPAKPEEDL